MLASLKAANANRAGLSLTLTLVLALALATNAGSSRFQDHMEQLKVSVRFKMCFNIIWND